MADSSLASNERIALLLSAFPARTLLHVGDLARHHLADYAAWSCESAVFVIAEEDRERSLAKIISAQPNWVSVRAVVTDAPGEREYFILSNPRESGLFPADCLTGIWRNIKTVATQVITATTLDDVLKHSLPETTAVNWIVLNTLSALSVLRGATSTLPECDVLLARTVLESSASGERLPTLRDVDDYVFGQGFRRAGIQEERHSAMGTAIYVRDWRRIALKSEAEARAMIDRLTVEIDGRQRAAIEVQGQLAQLQVETGRQTLLAHQYAQSLNDALRERDEIRRLADQLQQRLEHQTIEHATAMENSSAQISSMTRDQSLIAAERDEALRSAEDLQRRLTQLTIEHTAALEKVSAMDVLIAENRTLIDRAIEARDAHALHAQQREDRIAALAAELENSARETAEVRATVDSLRKSRDDALAETLDAKTQIERLSASLVERNLRIAELERQHDELKARQARLDQEVLKAEVQIELIKDVVLREKAF